MKTAPKRLWIFIAILFFAGILKANLPQTVIGSWTAAANLSQARTNTTAVMLPDGRVLFTGGDGANGPLQSSEFFNTNGVVSSAAPMNVARSRHFAVVLSDGRVLVGGGTSGGGTTNSAEIYDPARDSWTVGNPMMEARANATAALLQDGRVVVAGGDNSGFPSSTVEIFDPASGTFGFAGTLSSPRTKHAMALLHDGRVLIVGGFDGNNPLASSDIFDPASGTVSAGPSLVTARYAHSATTLLDGRVVVIAGAGLGSNGTVDLASAEILDPTTGVFSDAGIGLTAARQAHQAFLLPNNNSVLIFGGTTAGQVAPSSELFTPQASPADGSWSYAVNPTGANVTSRSGAAGSAMQQDGLLLAAGGDDAAGNVLSSTELYAFPTVKTDASDYAPGTIVTITGAGWKPGETVTLTLVESPFIDTHPVMTAIADGNGNISNNQFSPDIYDVNVRFFLSAVGSQSGLQALNTFTDGNVTSLSGTVKSSVAGNPAIVGATITCTSGCLTTQSTTSGAGGAYSFTGGNKLNFATNGPVTLVLTASAPGFSPGTITLSNVNNSDSFTNENFLLTPANIVTTTTVSSSTNPSVFGQSVTFTATVTPGSGSTAPTGTVQFVVDGSNFGAAVNLVPCSPSPNACATTSTSSLSVGSHTVTANYTATGNFTSSSGSLSGGQVVNKANTSSTVASSLNPSNYGQSITFTATVAAVSPGSGTPTGTVDFKDGSATIGSGVALSGGQASFSTAALGAATHSITAVYNGDGNFNATGTGTSTATALSQVVNPATVTASIINNPSKPYDGNANATLASSNYSLSGLVGADSFTVNQTAGTYNSKDVATANFVTASLTAANFTPVGITSANNYTLPTTASGPGHITAVTVNATVIGNPTKPYDGNTNATLASSNFSLSGLVGSENFTVTKTYGTYNSKDVVSATTVNVTLAAADFTPTGGALASNYTLPASASGAGQITAVTLTAAIIGNPSRPYDGTTSATLTSANFQLMGLVAGESIAVNQTAGLYNSKDVLAATTVSASLTAANFSAGGSTLLTNYVLPSSASGAGQITPKTVTASIIGNPSKTYDGNTSAMLTSANFSLMGVVTGESFTVMQTSGTYNSKDVATATTVSATLAATDFTPATGTLSSNYSLPTSASGPGQITPKSVMASIIGTPTKTYDGNTTATLAVANFSLSGLVAGESFTVTQTAGAYDTKNVTATTISATLSSGNFLPAVGTLATNYTLPTTASGPGQVTARPLTVTATGVNKVYDGTTTATVTLSDDRVSGDVVNDAYTTASFADKNVAMGKPVNVSGISISGADSANYILQNTTANTTADTTQRPLTVTATGVNKVYDGTNVATVTLSDDRVAGDAVTDSYTSASFSDKNVANGKAVSVSGISISGTDSGNYHLVNTTANTIADITARPLTITATGVNKVYDGTQTATVTLSDDRLTGDIFTDSYTSSTFADKNVGVAKAISVMGISISGTDSGNYTFSTTVSAAADITARHITVTATTDGKTYDGNTISTAVPTITYGSLAPGDSPNFTQSFDSRNAGARVLTASGSVIDGNSGNNYAVTFKTANGTISQLAITVTAAPDTKTYDGAVSSSGTPNISPAPIAPDSPNFIQAFDSKNAGARTLTPSGSVNDGNSGQNYAVTFKTAAGTINPAPLIITAGTNTKTYDGGTNAMAVPMVSGLQGSDTVTNLSEKYTDPNAGTGKTLVVNAGFIVNDGNNGNNYAVSTANNTTGVINKANATIVVTPYNVTYNGSAHTATGSAIGVLSENLTGLDLSATTHTNAGNYTDSWIFTDVTGNYYNSNGIVNDVIGKANATVNVTPYNVAYDGNPHTATGSAKGVLNESLSGLNLSGTTHTNPGDYPSDSWTFTDSTGNYNNSNGTVHDSIGYGTCNAGFGPGQVILPPINSDGTSVYQRKGGSTIPVKFRVCTASGTPISNPSLVFAGTGGTLTMLSAVRGTIDSVNENSSTDIPDVAFRWDSSGQQWMFNMATTNLTSGSTDTFQINLAYGNIRFVVGVK